jgi:prolipoprotein diacylglyceryltransferase
MYPTLPFGPFSLPTGPILAMLAALLMLDIAGRYARRFGRAHALHPDDVWNTGMIALAAGLIVARLWNVFQFWPIYREEPLLIVSLRPSGFSFWPGVVAALIGGYAYMLRRALDPARVVAALAVGLLVGAAVLAVSDHLTGQVLGLPSDGPLATRYFLELRHPAGLYRAGLLLLALVAIWLWADPMRPGRIIWMVGLGYSLARLIADGFVADAPMVGTVRSSQVVALIAALLFTALLARGDRSSNVVDETAEASVIS